MSIPGTASTSRASVRAVARSLRVGSVGAWIAEKDAAPFATGAWGNIRVAPEGMVFARDAVLDLEIRS